MTCYYPSRVRLLPDYPLLPTFTRILLLPDNLLLSTVTRLLTITRYCRPLPDFLYNPITYYY